MPLVALIHCQSGKPQNGQWVSGEASMQTFCHLLRNHVPTGDSDKTCDSVPVHCRVIRSSVVSKLILAGVALEKAFEVDSSAAKFGSAIPGLQHPDPNFELRVSHGITL
jgi:hypothetical protein